MFTFFQFLLSNFLRCFSSCSLPFLPFQFTFLVICSCIASHTTTQWIKTIIYYYLSLFCGFIGSKLVILTCHLICSSGQISTGAEVYISLTSKNNSLLWLPAVSWELSWDCWAERLLLSSLCCWGFSQNGSWVSRGNIPRANTPKDSGRSWDSLWQHWKLQNTTFVTFYWPS